MTGSGDGTPAIASRASHAAQLKVVIGLAISAALVWLIVQRVDFANMLAAIRSLSWSTLSAAAIVLALDFAAKIARWHLLLAPVAPGITWRAAAQTIMANVALNNLLPLRAGDAARVFAFREVLGAPASELLPLMVLERLLDTGMLVILAAGVLIPIQHAGLLPQGFGFIPPLAGALVASAAALAIFAGPVSQLAKRYEGWLAQRLPAAARAPFAQATAAIARQLDGPHAAKLVALTAVAWLLEGAMFCVLAAGFHIPQPLLAGALACALATLSGLIPSAPGAFGTFHAAAIAAVTLLGANTDTATAFAVVAHALMWVPLSLAGIACLAALSMTKTAKAPEETA